MRRKVFVGALLFLAVPMAPLALPSLVEKGAFGGAGNLVSSGMGLRTSQVSLDPARQVIVIRGLVLQEPHLSLKIGHLFFSLARRGPAHAWSLWQTAAATNAGTGSSESSVGAPSAIGTVAASDIRIETDAWRARIEHINLQGTQLSKVGLDALFDARAPGTAAERLAKISAAHVAISQITLESKQSAPQAQAQSGTNPDTDAKALASEEKITLSDIAMDDVLRGQAGLAVIGAMSIVIHADAGEAQVALGPTRATGFDLVEATRLLSGADAKGSRQKLCDGVDIDGVNMTAPSAEMGLGSVAIKNVTSGSLQSLLKSGDRLGKEGAPAQRATDMARLLQNIDIGSLEFGDLRFSTTGGTTPWSVRIAHGFGTRMHAAALAETGLDDITAAGAGATVKIGHLAWRDTAVAVAPAEKLLPNKIGPPEAPTQTHRQELAADGVDVDLGNLEPAAPSHFRLAHLEMTGIKSGDDIPSQMRAAVDHLTFDIDGTKEGDFAEIAALGYGKLDLSSRLNAHFDKESGAFSLDALSLSGADMGSVQISGRFDHVTKALFSADQADMEAGLLSLLARRVEIRLQNNGLFERLVAAEARKENMTPATIRTKYADKVTHDLPALLGKSRSAEAIVAAVAKFIAEPRNLRLSATAPEGIAALQILLAKDPAMLLQQLDIEAAADE